MLQIFEDVRETDQDKKTSGKGVFIVPFIILFVGIIAYHFIPFEVYDDEGVFVGGLFTDLQDIIDAVCDKNDLLPYFQRINGVRVFWNIWLASFIASLFFVGKRLHEKPQSNTEKCILVKKEPYLMILKVSNILTEIMRQRGDRKLNELLNSVKRLEEKFFVESDFGYGNNAVIENENNIAQQLQLLLDTVSNIEIGNLEENIKISDKTILQINSLLSIRMELKKI